MNKTQQLSSKLSTNGMLLRIVSPAWKGHIRFQLLFSEEIDRLVSPKWGIEIAVLTPFEWNGAS